MPPLSTAASAASTSTPTSSPSPRPSSPRPSSRNPVTALTGWVREDARFDVPASLVVFLVAVPLSLGIAVASGAPVAAGLIAAAVGGIVAGLVGGAPLQVSGPAAGLTVVVAETVAQFGWAATCAITVMAGLLQLLLGATRLGRFALAISPTVVSAMLAGIGISIVLGQLNVAVGSTSQPSAWGNVAELGSAVTSPTVHAVVAALAVVAVLVAWPRLPSAVRRVPGPLVAVSGVTLVAALWLPDAVRVDLGGDLLGQIGGVALPDEPPLAVMGAVLTVALIASVESLLSAVAVDKLHDGQPARLNRELVGQGAANTVSGALGGLPVTGVIVRSATNVAAGARTRGSAVLHGVWVLVFALLLVSVVEQIPLAALAGLLLVMGAQLVRPSDIRRSRARGELWIYVLTVAAVLALNLVEGVMIGLVAAVLLVLRRMAKVGVQVHERGPAADDRGRTLWVVEVTGSLSFLATPLLVRRLGSIPEGQVVEIDLFVDYLDPAGRDQVDEWRRRYEARGGLVVIEHSGSHDADAPERPGKGAPLPQRAWLPWASWQSERHRSLVPGDGVAHPLALGVREFHRRTNHTLKPFYEELKDGQQPEAVFVGCVDSRLVPNVLTSSGPGDLFTVRTMGNLVPAPGSPDTAVSAPLLYAVDQLGVDTVVVCGHSGCGAMAAAHAQCGANGAGTLDDTDPCADPVGTWVAHATEAYDAWATDHPVARAAAEDGWSEGDQLGMVNVAVALDRVRAVLGPDRAHVRVVGMFYALTNGHVHVLRDDRFVDLVDGELTELAHLERAGTN